MDSKQSTTQSINQPTNQPINQSINQSINHGLEEEVSGVNSGFGWVSVFCFWGAVSRPQEKRNKSLSNGDCQT